MVKMSKAEIYDEVWKMLAHVSGPVTVGELSGFLGIREERVLHALSSLVVFGRARRIPPNNLSIGNADMWEITRQGMRQRIEKVSGDFT